MHAAETRSTFSTQNAKRLTGSGHFLKLGRGKLAHRCGAKHICKSKCTKHISFGPLLEVLTRMRTAVARSTFASQNVQNTSVLDHFWKFRYRKIVRRCGANHIFKSKCTKHTIILGPLFEVSMSKNCAPLWREAHFQVKMHKTHHYSRTTF